MFITSYHFSGSMSAACHWKQMERIVILELFFKLTFCQELSEIKVRSRQTSAGIFAAYHGLFYKQANKIVPCTVPPSLPPALVVRGWVRGVLRRIEYII